ncbi:MAG: CoA transferase [Dehalococcoidia bacterium]|nr:CoA transferase [Dehalococcoidia bacterium]
MQQPLEPQPLSDLRVIDLTQGIAGPYCTKLLADFGADVIKIERPGHGDWARALGPFPGDVPHHEKSGLFLLLNTNKRSVALDLAAAQGVEMVKALVRGADILVESFRPGVMERLGLGYEVLSKLNPNLVMTSLSNFGQTGPYRDYLASELTLFAMGGPMCTEGLAERYPLKLGGNHVQFQAGNVGAMASLLAWHGHKYQGLEGQWVDVSIFETQMASINSRLSSLVRYAYTQERGRRRGPIGGAGYPQGYYPTQDGYVQVQGGGYRWPNTVSLLGMPELLNDPRYGSTQGQRSPEGKEEFEATYWLPWLLERTKLQAVQECQAHGVFAGAINTFEEVVGHSPQLDSRDYFVEINHPVAGRFKYPGSPMYSPQGWWRIRRPAPLLGEHTQEVLKEAKPHQQPVAVSGGSQGDTDSQRLPLEGIRVVDLTVWWAGPYATMFMGDMGAEIVRVESLNLFPSQTRGMYARPSKEAEATAPTSAYPNRDPGERAWNRAAGFNQHSRNKYSMTADLSLPEGKEVFRRLIEVSDVFIENNGVGSMARLGLTYDVVSKWNPRLIMISSTGFGQTGPWSQFRGHGGIFEGLIGHASIIGYPDMDVEGIPGSVASDAAAGPAMVMAAIMALHQREKTGKGCFVDLAQGENLLHHFGEHVMDYSINGRAAHSLGNRDIHLVQGAYPCAGDDEWIAISIGKIEQWRTLCRVMGRPELIGDERISTWEKLKARHDEVDEIISAWTADQSNVGLFHILQSQGIPAGPVMHEALAYADPHMKARGFFVEIAAPEVGTYRYPSTTFKMSKTPFLVRKPPVRLGEDNDYLYRQVLKLSQAEYDRLKDLGQVGMDYAPHVQ